MESRNGLNKNNGSKLISILVALLMLGLTTHQVMAPQFLSTRGELDIKGISVERINLAVKEIDVEIGILEVSVNSPFNLTIWTPLRTGGSTFSANGTKIPNSTWYEFIAEEFKVFRAVGIETVGGLNSFPFETYRTEIVFAISATNIQGKITFEPWLSYELEQQGYWMVNAEVKNSSSSKISEIKALHNRTINERGLITFLSLFINLQHPLAFQIKMVIPTWGITFFIILLGTSQFIFLGKKLKRSDHISMFLALIIFMLGASFTIREMTPPELTCPELLNFVFLCFYTLILFRTIHGQHHKPDIEKRRKKTRKKESIEQEKSKTTESSKVSKRRAKSS